MSVWCVSVQVCAGVGVCVGATSFGKVGGGGEWGQNKKCRRGEGEEEEERCWLLRVRVGGREGQQGDSLILYSCLWPVSGS